MKQLTKQTFFLRNILKEVKVSGEIHIVLDCHYDKVCLLLKMCLCLTLRISVLGAKKIKK